jgi:DNA repair protein RadD
MLRPYQKAGVDALRQCYAIGKKAPLYVLPTGGGKTFVFTYIAKNITSRGRRACILVHRAELLKQASKSLKEMGVDHGIIAPGWSYRGESIAVASVQTLARRIKTATAQELERIYKFDLIIVDEAHHAVAGTWRKILEFFSISKWLGVTATPCRSDGSGLGVHAGGCFDDMVRGPSVKELIEMGFLCRPIVYAPPTKVDLSKVHIRRGDYDHKELAAELDKPTITGNAVAHYARLCPFKPAVVFCVSVEHAKHVAMEFRMAGFTAYSLDGTASDSERSGILDGLARGEIHVVTSCDLISEGTDIPAVQAAILLRPTKSEGLYLQQVGRALRIAPNKNYALILDHVGNCLVHGLPDDDREWTLDGNAKKSRKQSEKVVKDFQCVGVGGCYAFYPPAPKCPYCGKEREVKERKIEEIEGELKQLTPEEIQAIRKQNHRENKTASTVSELIALAKKRGYKNPYWWAKQYANARGIKE